MSKKIIALKILPDQLHADPFEIEDNLKTYQDYVGGCIECVTFESRYVMIVNDNGLFEDLPYNKLASALYASKFCAMSPIVGNAIIVGKDGENFKSVPFDVVMEINRLAFYLRQLEDNKADGKEANEEGTY